MKSNQLYFTLGRPFSPVYSVIMRLRERMYARGVFKVHSMEVPVISVGNLTMGGTGKTPLVQHIAKLLHGNGYRPAVISRGYGGAAKNPFNIVSDGRQIFLDASAAGDETRLLAESLPGVPVLTGIVRTIPSQKAVELGADVLVLDDGFQHMRLNRQVNLVLFNSDSLAGNSRVFPGGHLREPVAALCRATDFIMTGVHDNNRARAEQFLDLLETKIPGKGRYLASYTPSRYVQLTDAGMIAEMEADKVRGKRAFGFCGIARPESFKDTLEHQKVPCVGFQSFKDHEAYSVNKVDKILAQAKRAGAEILLTTEKDLVKFTGIRVDLPVYAIAMKVSVEGEFDAMLLNAVKG